MPNILFFGPIPPPVFGEAIAFRAAYEGTKTEKKWLVNKNVVGKNPLLKVWLHGMSLAKLSWILLLQKVDIVYISCSRGKVSCWRDIITIFLSKTLFGKKIIVHLHGADFLELLTSVSFPTRLLLYAAYRQVDIGIVLDKSLKSQFAAFQATMQVRVVSNFYDTYLESFDESSTQNTDSQIIIGYFSNLMFSKGIVHLLEAFDILSQQYGNISLQLAGSILSDALGTQEELAQILQKHLTQNNRIKYFGALIGEEKLQFLSRSVIVVLAPIIKEGIPIAILEALRTGNAIVVNNLESLPSLVSAEVGIVVKAGSAQRLADGIAYLLEHPTERRKMQQHNISLAKKRYAQQPYLESLKQIFQEVMTI